MTGNIPSSNNGKTGKNTVIRDVEDEVYELPDSDISKSAARVFDNIYNGKDGALPSSKSFDLIETIEEGSHSEELAGNLQKADPNESGSLDRFAFVRWYVDEEVSLDSAEEANCLVSWGCKFSLMDRQ